MELTTEQKEDIRKRLGELLSEYDENKKEITKDVRAYGATIDKLPEYVETIDAEFEELTKVTKKDISFLIFASALQVARQWLTSWLKTRLTDKEAAKRTLFHSEEHSDRRVKRYYATNEEIISNPVPFDAVRKTDNVKNNGNPKLNGFNHRYLAIGHDPILGLLFGTANIMTKTISVSKGKLLIETYHVGSGIASNGKSEYKIDMLTSRASTSLMFEHIFQRIKDEGIKGWETLAISLRKEIIHLLSDVRTAKSLPLPFISAASPDISRILNLCGIDALSIGTFTLDILISKLINMSIAWLHTLCYNPDTDGSIETYEVRTKNIICYSNLVSLASTTLQTVVRSCIGDISAISKFDFGGSIVSWRVIWETPQMVSDIKSEYIRNKTINYLRN